MKFTLEIECGNAAFEPSETGVSGDEIARILTVAAQELTWKRKGMGDERSLRDVNGNTVGKWAISE